MNGTKVPGSGGGKACCIRGKPAPRNPEARLRGERNRRSGAPAGERPTSLGVRRKALNVTPRLSALRSLTIGEGRSLLVKRGDGNDRRSPRLARTGAAELCHLPAGCLKCESDVRARTCGGNPDDNVAHHKRPSSRPEKS